MGNPQAPLVMLAYSEFQCPYCGRFARDTMPDLDREYVRNGKVRFVFKHLPLERIHTWAVKAAEAAECAGAQGRFWEMHDALFKDQKALDEVSLTNRGATIGLNRKAFTGCLKGTMTARVRRDLAEAEEFGIGGTPTFLIGTIDATGQMKAVERLSGALPFVQFKSVLDRLLQGSGTR